MIEATATTKLPLLVVGYGGHGRVIADAARAAGETVQGFLDDNPSLWDKPLSIKGPIRLEITRCRLTNRFIVGIGDTRMRRDLCELIIEEGGELATLIHPSALISSDVEIGVGTVILARAVIGTGSRIGRFAVVNTGAILDHDNIVGDNVHVSPGCTFAGSVECKEDAFIGTGATIIPKQVVGQGAYVAAGATVIRSVRPFTLVAGCPAIEKRAALPDKAASND